MRTRTFRESYGELTRLVAYRDTWAWYGALLVLLVLVPLVFPSFIVSFGTMIFISATGAVGLNLVTGTTGMISLGYAGFLALGAYTTAILLTDHHWPLLAAMAAGGLVSAGVSLLVGVPSLRLKGLYLAITTLAFSIILTTLILEAGGLTGGSGGKSVVRPDLFGLPMNSGASIYYLALAVAGLTIVGALNLLRSRVGRAWGAIRDYDIAAGLMGINLRRYKLLAFVVSAFVTGMAGSVLALHLRYINVDSFEFITSIEALTMIIVGGLGSVRGAVLGAVVITLLPEMAAAIFQYIGGPMKSLSEARAPELKGVIYALIIMFFLRFEPDGIEARWKHIKRFWLEWPFSRRRS